MVFSFFFPKGEVGANGGLTVRNDTTATKKNQENEQASLAPTHNKRDEDQSSTYPSYISQELRLEVKV